MGPVLGWLLAKGCIYFTSENVDWGCMAWHLSLVVNGVIEFMEFNAFWVGAWELAVSTRNSDSALSDALCLGY